MPPSCVPGEMPNSSLSGGGWQCRGADSLATTVAGIPQPGRRRLPRRHRSRQRGHRPAEKLARIDLDMAGAANDGQALLEQLGDLARLGLRRGAEFNPERLAEVEERLDPDRGLKRKYGDTIEQISVYGTKDPGRTE